MTRRALMLLGISLFFIAAQTTDLRAYYATSTGFGVRQNIQSISGGSPSASYSTSSSFKVLGAGGQNAVGISTSTSFTNHAGYLSGLVKSQFGEEASLSFFVDSNTKSFGIIAPGIVAAATSSLGVTTANSSGFTISVNRSDADTTLDLDANAAVNITDKTTWNAGGNCASVGNATASTTEPQTLQFRVRQAGTDTVNYCSAWWGTDDTTANARFAGFPQTGEDIIYRPESAPVQTNSIILYNLTVPMTQVEGVYSGEIIYTAVANP